MKISASVHNGFGTHHAAVTTAGQTTSIAIPPKATGYGSSANGGELLFLALATCYCNDIYREAAKREITVESVEVSVEGEGEAEGAAATGVTYRARVVAHATEAEIRDFTRQTDTVAEIQNTLRAPTPVTLQEIEAVALPPEP